MKKNNGHRQKFVSLHCSGSRKAPAAGTAVLKTSPKKNSISRKNHEGPPKNIPHGIFSDKTDTYIIKGDIPENGMCGRRGHGPVVRSGDYGSDSGHRMA